MHKPSKSLPLIISHKPKSISPHVYPFSEINPMVRITYSGSVRQFLANRSSFKYESGTPERSELVGPQAKINFYDSYKKLPAITERNKFKKLEDSPSIAYLQEIDKKRLNPQPFGIIRAKGNESSIDLQGLCIGDNYASALSQGLNHVKSIESVNLKRNRLTETGAKCILAKLMSQKLKELNLSDNQLGTNSMNLIISLVSQENSVLNRLNLENVNTKEENIKKLLICISKSTSINQINLAKNALTIFSAEVLREVLAVNTGIVRLDLHWNNFTGDAGVLIFQGLEKNKVLQELDLSWNPIGNNTLPDTIEKISSVLKNQRFLMHLDMSYNKLNINEITVLAEAMLNNHSLYGIHMEGNNCMIDGNGFLQVQKNRELQESGLLFRRLFKDGKKKDNCWICEKWVEVAFKFSFTQPPPVFIHFECDSYSPYLLKEEEGRFEITRALPQKPQTFFFSSGKKIFLSNDFPVTDLETPLEYTTINNELIKVREMNWTRAKGAGFNMKFPFSTHPRVKGTYKEEKTEERILWQFENSIFKDYIRETQQLLNDCFEFDWNLSRLGNLIKDPIDKRKTKKYLKSVYSHIRLCYKSLSSFSGSDIYSIGTNTLTDFLYLCKIIDPLYLINDLGVNWNSTNVPLMKDQLFNPGSALVRYEFMEILVRISQDRFIRNKICPTFKKAVKKLMNEHILPSISNFQNNSINTMNSNWWRENAYFCEDVDLVLKAYKTILEATFQKYSGKKTLPGYKKFMCLEEFEELCKDTEMINEEISNREIGFCFVQAMMTQVDELYKKRHFEMTFVEFLEAISRVCDMRNGNGVALHEKLDKDLQKLIKVCPKSIRDNFVIPNEAVYREMKYKTSG